jgi:hypothetical protein
LDAAIFASYDGNWENVFALETTMKDRI